jgi:hypothetical protein
MDEFELTRRILEEPDADPSALERVRERLHEAVGLELRQRRSPRWRRVFPIAAALAWVIALVVALTFTDGRDVAAGPDAKLRRLGRIASTRDELSPGSGQFFLIRSEELRLESFSSLETDVSFDRITRLSISTWLAPDGSGFRQERVLSSRFASDADRMAWIEAGRPSFELDREYRFPPGQSVIHDVAGLPADPDRLLELLRSGAVVEGSPGDDQVFIDIGQLLAQGVAPPEVRGALFEAATRLDGVELVGDVEDPLGRPGIGITIAGVSDRTRLVFDPRSARLLAIERYVPDDAGSGERLESWIASYPTTVVDERPRTEG